MTTRPFTTPLLDKVKATEHTLGCSPDCMLGIIPVLCLLGINPSAVLTRHRSQRSVPHYWLRAGQLCGSSSHSIPNTKQHIITLKDII